MAEHLPTITSSGWTVASFLDAVVEGLQKDTDGVELRLFAYAVTVAGWNLLSPAITKWQAQKKSRTVLAFIGTDHGLTDPDALKAMHDDGVDVRIMDEYHGVYHPKVIWKKSNRGNTVWVGSNNFTGDGLRNNIEYAAEMKSNAADVNLTKWSAAVEAGSTAYSPALVDSYRKEREQFEKKRAGGGGSFTWSGRKKARKPAAPAPTTVPPQPPKSSPVRSGDLAIEIMPLETGAGGKQVQLPKAAATQFFGLPSPRGSSISVQLKSVASGASSALTLTMFGNDTTRLSVGELDYSDRPCVMVFRKLGKGRFQFEIVSRSVMPRVYAQVLRQCAQQTRRGSRRWAII